MLQQPFFAWLVASRRGVSVGALALASVLAYFQTSIAPAPSSEMRQSTVTPTYVGSLTLSKGNHTGTDAGYGIGVPNDRETNDLLKRLKPTLYVPFHPDLKLNANDIARGIKPGFTYTLTLWQGQIISIADENREIISREEYASRVERRRATLLYWSIGVATAAAIFWLIATLLARRARSGG